MRNGVVGAEERNINYRKYMIIETSRYNILWVIYSHCRLSSRTGRRRSRSPAKLRFALAGALFAPSHDGRGLHDGPVAPSEAAQRGAGRRGQFCDPRCSSLKDSFLDHPVVYTAGSQRNVWRTPRPVYRATTRGRTLSCDGNANPPTDGDGSRSRASGTRWSRGIRRPVVATPSD
jgi:hypothetical protein